MIALRWVALLCLSGAAASTQDAPPNFYPLDPPKVWVYQTNLNGVESIVHLRNAGRSKMFPQFFSQEATVNGKLVETRLLVSKEDGVFLAGTITEGLPPAVAADPRPLILYPVTARRQWHGEIEERIACATPAKARLKLAVDETDQLRVGDITYPAVRVNSTATFSESCAENEAPLQIDYQETSWFIENIGLGRSLVTIRALGTVRVNSVELIEFRPDGKARRGAPQ